VSVKLTPKLEEAFTHIPPALRTVRAKKAAMAIQIVLDSFCAQTDLMPPDAVPVLAASIAGDLERNRKLA
jgi:hypothetical protein